MSGRASQEIPLHIAHSSESAGDFGENECYANASMIWLGKMMHIFRRPRMHEDAHAVACEVIQANFVYHITYGVTPRTALLRARMLFANGITCSRVCACERCSM